MFLIQKRMMKMAKSHVLYSFEKYNSSLDSNPEYEPSKIDPEIPGPRQPDPKLPEPGDPPNLTPPLQDPPPSAPEPTPAQQPPIKFSSQVARA